MTDIEQRAREVAQGVVSRMCRTSHNRVIFDDEVEREIADALLAFHRDSLTVPEEVEKVARTADGWANVAGWLELTLDRKKLSKDSKAFATLIRHQAARIAEMKTMTSTELKRLDVDPWAEERALRAALDEATARAASLAAQVETMRSVVEAAQQVEWRSPYEPPGFCGATAIRVLVKIERRHNPPALNAPPRFAFGHCIPKKNNSPAWPNDGWFFDGQRDGDDERVVAWRFIETDKLSTALAALKENPDADI